MYVLRKQVNLVPGCEGRTQLRIIFGLQDDKVPSTGENSVTENFIVSVFTF
jgi:hypothetical protein